MIGPDIEHVQLRHFQDGAIIQSAHAGQSMKEMAEEADANLLLVIKDLREAARLADQSNDPGSVDLFFQNRASTREARVVFA